jgi:hypothetical protein
VVVGVEAGEFLHLGASTVRSGEGSGGNL